MATASPPPQERLDDPNSLRMPAGMAAAAGATHAPCGEEAEVQEDGPSLIPLREAAIHFICSREPRTILAGEREHDSAVHRGHRPTQEPHVMAATGEKQPDPGSQTGDAGPDIEPVIFLSA